MVAMLAFGGTYAYFTATATTGVAGQTIGTGRIELTVKDDGTPSIFNTNITKLLPGDAIFDEGLTLTTANSTDDSYVAIKVTIEGSVADLAIAPATATGVDGATWVKAAESQDKKTVVYVLGANTDAAEVDNTAVISVFGGDTKYQPAEDVDNLDGTENTVMGKTMTISVEAKSIQVRNFNGGAATTTQVAEKLFPVA